MPQPLPDPRHPLIWFLGVGILGLLLILTAFLLRASGRPAQLTLDPLQIEHLGGHAFLVELRGQVPRPWQALGDNLFNLHRSDLLLLEDGRLAGRPHTAFDGVRDEGAGAYLHWGRLLIFSTSDGTDPRTNGRGYQLEFTAGIEPRILQRLANAGALLLLAAGLGWLWIGRRRVAASFAKARRHLIERRLSYALGALPPALLSMMIWWHLPALWNGSDSVIWLLWQLTWIPHHPPLYPGLMALLHGIDADPDAVLNGVRGVQHLVFVVSVAYLAAAGRRAWQVLLLSVAATLGAGLGLFAHGLFTEGLAIPLMLLFLGAVLRLARDGPTGTLTWVLALSLLLASLSRHVLIVLAAIPFCLVALQALGDPRSAAQWRGLGGAALIVLGVWVANTGVNRYVSLMLDAQQVPILGRAGVYRIQSAVELIPEDQRRVWVADLQAGAGDPSVGQALALMAWTPNPWTGPRDAIADSPALFGRHPDLLMNAGFKVFVSRWDPYALRQWAQELSRASLGTGQGDYCPGQVSCLLQGTLESVEVVFPGDPRSLVAVTGTGAEDPGSAAAYRRIAAEPWVPFLDGLLPLAPPQRSIFLGLSFGLLVLAVSRRRRSGSSALLLSLWIGGLVYAVALTFVTVVLPRYLVPIDILLWLANALAVIDLIEGAAGRSGRPGRASPAQAG